MVGSGMGKGMRRFLPPPPPFFHPLTEGGGDLRPCGHSPRPFPSGARPPKRGLFRKTFEEDMRPAFITFDGVDGSGKSTHISSAVDWITKTRGLECLFSREPGGTKLGERIRGLLLEVNEDPNDNMDALTETLLLFAARNDHVKKKIEPALKEGKWVVLDRFTDATYAYQCSARGFDEKEVAILENLVHGHLQPDLTFIFDIPVEESMRRVQKSRDKDRFEREDKEFFEKVRAGYLARAKANPARYVVLDTTRTIDEVKSELISHLEKLADSLAK